MKFELEIIEFLQSNATYGWIKFFGAVTMLGGFLGMVIGAIIVWKRGKGLSITLILTFLCASLINYVLKVLISRARPFEVSQDILNLGGESGYSFPSGHSVGAGVIATFLFYALVSSKQGKGVKVAGCIAISLYPILIAFSRMVLGVHYLTDTIAGIILGVLLALVGVKLYNIAVKKIETLKQEGIEDDE